MNIQKDLITGKKYTIEHELYQSYERFNVYHVYKKYIETGERIFLYNETKTRLDYGRKIQTKREILENFKKLEAINGKKDIKE